MSTARSKLLVKNARQVLVICNKGEKYLTRANGDDIDVHIIQNASVVVDRLVGGESSCKMIQLQHYLEMIFFHQ